MTDPLRPTVRALAVTLDSLAQFHDGLADHADLGSPENALHLGHAAGARYAATLVREALGFEARPESVETSVEAAYQDDSPGWPIGFTRTPPEGWTHAHQ